jgi:phage-related protein
LEKGAKATDWTPPPEDVASDINATNSLVEKVRSNLQSQIDGEITSWFHEGEPSTSNAPANGWTSDDEKIRHEGDLYYNTATGGAYRWIYDDTEKAHKWLVITDEAIAKALSAANTAQTTADGKMKVFSV